MKDDGYTLSEVLAAMLILGLAVGGLLEGTRALGRLQKPINTRLAIVRDTGRAEAAVSVLLRARDPEDRSLVGDKNELWFDCVQGRCGLRLRTEGGRTLLVVHRGEVAQSFSLPATANAALVYDTGEGRYSRWPPSDVRRTLRGVAVVDFSSSGDTPVIVVRSWIEHPKTCEFDMITGACRTPAP